MPPNKSRGRYSVKHNSRHIRYALEDGAFVVTSDVISDEEIYNKSGLYISELISDCSSVDAGYMPFTGGYHGYCNTNFVEKTFDFKYDSADVEIKFIKETVDRIHIRMRPLI